MEFGAFQAMAMLRVLANAVQELVQMKRIPI